MSRGRRVWAYNFVDLLYAHKPNLKHWRKRKKQKHNRSLFTRTMEQNNNKNCNKTIRVAQFIKIWLKSQYGECNIPITRNCHFLIKVKCVTKQQYNKDNGTFCEENLHQKHMKYRVLYISIHIYFLSLTIRWLPAFQFTRRQPSGPLAC